MSYREPQDDDGVIDKISSGRVTSLNLKDAATAGNTALNVAGYVEKFVPSVGTLVSNSTPIGAGLAGITTYLEHQEQYKRVAGYFDVPNVHQAGRNPALRRKLKKLEEGVDWWNFAGHMGSSMGGAAIGATAATLLSIMVFPPIAFTLAPIAGSLVGGYVGNSLYSAAFEKQVQDPIIINMQIAKMHAAGEYVPPEVVFSALAANLPNKLGKRVVDRLDEFTNTSQFTEALADHNNIPKITAMMHSFDDTLRAAYGLPRDPQNPLKTVAEQYTDMINSGQMNPQNLLDNTGKGIQIMAAMMRQRDQGVDVPITPDSRQNYIGRTS